jgi:hypothetical protein
MAAVTLSTVVKKAAEVLLSTDKGRKFLGYTVGITVFIVLLPLIALVGLFGFMSGGDPPLNNDQIVAALSPEDKAFVQQIEDTESEIDLVFTERGLTEDSSAKAKALYMACLFGKESDSFVADLAVCFETVSENSSVYDNISEKFSVSFSEGEQNSFDERFGVTLKK